VLIEKTMISRLYKLDHLYGLLLTFGLGLIIEGLFRNEFGSSGMPYRIPAELQGAWDLGFMFMPVYRGWVVVVALVMCLATWLVIEKTKLGSYLRAATENPALVQAFGINVPRMMTLTYGAGVALAAFAGVLAAPIYFFPDAEKFDSDALGQLSLALLIPAALWNAPSCPIEIGQ
jgi:branched-chain amino acid transport system permease protein